MKLNVEFQIIAVWVMGISSLQGCTHISEGFYRTGLDGEVYANINLKDGVNSREAIIMAQRTLLNSEYSKDYFVSNPILGYDEPSNLWGVSFQSKKGGDDECNYCVMINKTTGKIEISGCCGDL